MNVQITSSRPSSFDSNLDSVGEFIFEAWFERVITIGMSLNIEFANTVNLDSKTDDTSLFCVICSEH